MKKFEVRILEYNEKKITAEKLNKILNEFLKKNHDCEIIIISEIKN